MGCVGKAPSLLIAFTAAVLAAGWSGGDEAADTAAASSCGEADGAPLQAGGTVAFVSPQQRGSTVVAVDTSGKRLRTMTRQRTRYDIVSSIAFSPNGRRLAYTASSLGRDRASDGLFVVRASGGAPRRLTRSGEDLEPEWSLDGRKLAFDAQRDGSNWAYVVDADGTGLRRLTRNFSWSPVWTPDGRVSFVTFGGIWTAKADGSDRRLLARAKVRITGYPPETPVAWSPDGRHVAFTSGEALWLLTADGRQRRKVFGSGGETGDPRWSPDGTRIAWTQGDGDFELYVVDRDGSGLRNVTNNGIADEQPAWSPNGRALAFLRTCDGETHVYAMNADGTGARRLSDVPLGQRIRVPRPAWGR
jgi:Tol biopolymer transport system component